MFDDLKPSQNQGQNSSAEKPEEKKNTASTWIS